MAHWPNTLARRVFNCSTPGRVPPYAPDRVREPVPRASVGTLVCDAEAPGGRRPGTETSMKKIVATQTAPAAIGPYSQAVVHNGIAYLSGQIPVDPESGEMVSGDIAVQTERVLRNLEALLTACGSSLDRVLKVTVYLRDMDEFAAMNDVYGRFFPEEPPARAAIQAARLPKDARIEMEAIATAG